MLGSGSDSPIRTLAGRGYQFAADVTEIAPVQVPPVGNPVTTKLTVESTQTRLVMQHKVEERFVWSKRAKALTLAFVLVVAAAGWFFWQRWLDHTGGAPVDVVVAPLDGTTGDPSLDGALIAAFRMDLSQSPFVSTIPVAKVRATLLEMKQKPDGPMDATVAREVCERANAQAVLQGHIARVGSHFLMTEEATNCADGATLAQTQETVLRTEELPHAVEEVASAMRRELGESRRSIARFNTPLLPANTSSLEALKNYSQAATLATQGKVIDAIRLEKTAIAADPGFAVAYYDLATDYIATEQYAESQEAIKKAYSLRDSAPEPVRLATVALYISNVTQDLYEAERNYRSWTEIYPRSPQAWSGLSLTERDLGHHSEALVAARHAFELRPTVLGVYANLAYEQVQTGDVKGSLVTCEKAIAKGLDGDYIRQHYFQAAYALKDTDLIRKQREWEAAHPDAVFIRIDEAEVATTEGRFGDANRLIAEIDTLLRRQGLTSTADDALRVEGSNLIEVGDVTDGMRLAKSVSLDPKSEYSVVSMARMGDQAAADAALHAMKLQAPNATIWNEYRAPEARAILAMEAHQPKEAIAALEQARPLEGHDPVLNLLRGNAYLEEGQPALAEKEYRRVLARPWLAPEMEEVPLSWLGLARSFAAERNTLGATGAYQHFLALWAHADPDAVLLKQAKVELSALQRD